MATKRSTLRKVGKPFVFIRKKRGLSTLELVGLGSYQWSNPLITDELFPFRNDPSAPRAIQLVKLQDDLTSSEVLAEFERRGLERPDWLDALQSGLSSALRRRRNPIIFLHEPVHAPDGAPVVLMVYTDDGWLCLDLEWFGHTWPRGTVFAAIYPNA